MYFLNPIMKSFSSWSHCQSSCNFDRKLTAYFYLRDFFWTYLHFHDLWRHRYDDGEDDDGDERRRLIQPPSDTWYYFQELSRKMLHWRPPGTKPWMGADWCCCNEEGTLGAYSEVIIVRYTAIIDHSHSYHVAAEKNICWLPKDFAEEGWALIEGPPGMQGCYV